MSVIFCENLEVSQDATVFDELLPVRDSDERALKCNPVYPTSQCPSNRNHLMAAEILLDEAAVALLSDAAACSSGWSASV